MVARRRLDDTASGDMFTPRLSGTQGTKAYLVISEWVWIIPLGGLTVRAPIGVRCSSGNDIVLNQRLRSRRWLDSG